MTRAIQIVFFALLAASAVEPIASEPATERTPRLGLWESLRYGMFIHYGMSTFTGREIDPGDAPASTYAPTALDVRQWIHVAKAAGMGYVVLTAKHVAGHCLWDSEGYDYDVASSADKTDVVAAFVDACRAEGIKPGLYYCVLDGHNEGGVKWDAPVGTEYFALIKRHLAELHTRYPGIFEQWIDIPAKLSLEQRRELYALVKRLNPDCLVLMNAGFSDGTSVSEGAWPTDLLDGERTPPPLPRHDPVEKVSGKTHYLPMEVCDTIGGNWFWIENDSPKPVRALYKLWTRTVGRGANLLLDVPPDKSGRIPKEHVERLMELKAVIDDPSRLPKPESIAFERPATASNVYQKQPQWGPEFAFDEDPGTRWATDHESHSGWLEVDLGEERRFDRAEILEAYAPRVRRFELQYLRGEEWVTFHRGTTLGECWSATFPPVTARVVRLNVLESTDGPTIWEFRLFAPAK